MELVTNRILVAPLCAWLIAQVLKVIIHALVERRFDAARLIGDGGMPSAHSATVSALVAMCAWGCGFGSPIFAVALILAIIVMHDATGVRRETGKQANTIKQIADIINGIFAGKDEEVRTEKLKEFVGHTPVQVFFGALLGVAVSVAYINIGGLGYGFSAAVVL